MLTLDTNTNPVIKQAFEEMKECDNMHMEIMELVKTLSKKRLGATERLLSQLPKNVVPQSISVNSDGIMQYETKASQTLRLQQ